MGNVFTSAQLVRASYRGSYDRKNYKGSGREDEFNREVVNAKLLHNMFDPASGFSASAWKVGRNYYITFTGTDLSQYGDIRTDVQLAMGNYPEENTFVHGDPRPEGKHYEFSKTQWGHARTFVRDLAVLYPDAKFTVAGHSLGGALAQYIANEDSVELVHAFNSPGFPNGGGYNPKVRH